MPTFFEDGERCCDFPLGAVPSAVKTAILRKAAWHKGFDTMRGSTENGAVTILGGISLKANEKKERHVVWLSPKTVARLDAANVFAGCKSRSEFVEQAVNFYAGYLSAQNHTDFFAQAISETVSGVIAATENRIARMQFKEAVELAKLTHILASMGEVDDETLRRLHIKCVDEVKRINGIVKYDDAAKYQHSE